MLCPPKNDELTRIIMEGLKDFIGQKIESDSDGPYRNPI